MDYEKVHGLTMKIHELTMKVHSLTMKAHELTIKIRIAFTNTGLSCHRKVLKKTFHPQIMQITPFSLLLYPIRGNNQSCVICIICG